MSGNDSFFWGVMVGLGIFAILLTGWIAGLFITDYNGSELISPNISGQNICDSLGKTFVSAEVDNLRLIVTCGEEKIEQPKPNILVLGYNEQNT